MQSANDEKNPTTPTSQNQVSPPKIRTLDDMGFTRLTPEQQKTFAAEQTRRNKAILDSLRKWTPDDVVSVINAFKEQYPIDYERYASQQRDMERESIDTDLSLIIKRLAKNIFNTQSLENIDMLYLVRQHIRSSLNLPM